MGNVGESGAARSGGDGRAALTEFGHEFDVDHLLLRFFAIFLPAGESLSKTCVSGSRNRGSTSPPSSVPFSWMIVDSSGEVNTSAVRVRGSMNQTRRTPARKYSLSF